MANPPGTSSIKTISSLVQAANGVKGDAGRQIVYNPTQEERWRILISYGCLGPIKRVSRRDDVVFSFDPLARSSLRSKSRRRYTMPFAPLPRRQPPCTKRR